MSMSRGGAQGLPASCVLAGFRAEDGHQAVTQVLVDLAAVPADGLAHLGEQPVENEYDVVGQARLADGGEAARVEKQNGEVALDALHFGGGRGLAGDPRGTAEPPGA